MRSRLKQILNGESGQTQTEYLMIVGLIAAVIVAVFTLFWGQISTAVQGMLSNITNAIGGGGIK